MVNIPQKIHLQVSKSCWEATACRTGVPMAVWGCWWTETPNIDIETAQNAESGELKALPWHFRTCSTSVRHRLYVSSVRHRRKYSCVQSATVPTLYWWCFFEILSDLTQAVPNLSLFLFFYLFLFHSLLRLTSFLSQNKNQLYWWCFRFHCSHRSARNLAHVAW